jgi:hypothetical protein
MRNGPLARMAALAAFSLVGFAGLPSEDPPPPADVLFLRTSEGIALVNARAQAPAFHLRNATPSTDWSAVVQATRRSGHTWVEAFDSASGDLLWSRQAPGNLEVKVASTDGRSVALGKPGGGTGYPAGRTTTRLVIIDQQSAKPTTIELQGNFEPEAFSTDGRSLFVIEYVPPERPSSYRVRRLDLTTQEVVGVYSVDEELQEAMQGTARIQAPSPDGKRLYTLYAIEGPDGARRAFIHVLSLDGLWAHCVDLPDAFGAASEASIALTVGPDGSRLYVAEGSTGAVAEVDTESLSVARTVDSPFDWRGGTAHAVSGPGGMLYLGKGTRLLGLETSTLGSAVRWELPGRITGLQAAGDVGRLYVGLKDQILILDTATGGTVGTIELEDIGTIDQLGHSTRPLDQERTEIVCAC